MNIEETINRIEVIKLEANDILVLNVPYRLSESTYAHLGQMLSSRMPNNKYIVLENGITVSVIKPD